jgi:hypothetical protein
VWLGWGLDWIGATAAFASFLGGRVASNAYLFSSCIGVLRRRNEVVAVRTPGV